jgi:hypothetical protein
LYLSRRLLCSDVPPVLLTGFGYQRRVNGGGLDSVAFAMGWFAVCVVIIPASG